jgi:V/A-type H+-transporting ATPase subunit E
MSEPLGKLQNRILSDAKLKVDGIIKEAQNKANEIVQNGKQEAERETQEILAKAKLDAEAVRRGILSSKVRANRLKILDEKNRIVEDIIKSVEDKLSDLSRSNQFQDTVKRLVSQAVDALGSDQSIVRIGFKQISKNNLSDLGDSLPRGSKLVVEDHPIDSLGGVVASDPEGKVVFNNSFRARLERMDNELFTVISSTLFGD